MKSAFPFFSITVPVSREEDSVNFLYSLGIESFAYKNTRNEYDIFGEGNYFSIECYLDNEETLIRNRVLIKSFFDNIGVESDLLIEYKAIEDWVNNYKNNFTPFVLIDGFYIIPPWEHNVKYHPKNSMILEPGMAFGTGTHFTTRSLCYLIMQSENPGNNFVMDLGSGTGILSLFSLKRKSKRIISIEKDEASIKNNLTNLLINDSENNILLIKGDIKRLPVNFSNIGSILLNVDFEIISEFLCRTRNLLPPRSRLLVSGILNNEKQEIEALFKEFDLKILAIMCNGEWISYSIEKK